MTRTVEQHIIPLSFCQLSISNNSVTKRHKIVHGVRVQGTYNKCTLSDQAVTWLSMAVIAKIKHFPLKMAS